MNKRESLKAKRVRAGHILQALKVLHPEAHTELAHNNAFELLVATLLSAQATDASVNKATPKLFEAFPTPQAMAQATPQDIAQHINTIGLYNSKAKHLHQMAQLLLERHGGQVPADTTMLQALPGVGWKTATVVLGCAFGIPGIAVDTHLIRLSHRLNWSKEHQPERISQDLQKLFAKEHWVYVHHALILFGRYHCTARKPKCEGCPLIIWCPQLGVT